MCNAQLACVAGARLRWPNTVFARALANAIQRAQKDCKKQTCRRYGDHFICSMPALSVLFFFVIERRVLRVLVFYYKGLLEKETMQRTQQFSAFSLLPKECSACVISQILRLNAELLSRKYAYFSRTHH